MGRRTHLGYWQFLELHKTAAGLRFPGPDRALWALPSYERRDFPAAAAAAKAALSDSMEGCGKSAGSMKRPPLRPPGRNLTVTMEKKRLRQP